MHRRALAIDNRAPSIRQGWNSSSAATIFTGAGRGRSWRRPQDGWLRAASKSSQDANKRAHPVGHQGTHESLVAVKESMRTGPTPWQSGKQMCARVCLYTCTRTFRSTRRGQARNATHGEARAAQWKMSPDESAVCEINAHAWKYREPRPAPRISMLTTKRAGGECEALRNKRPLL